MISSFALIPDLVFSSLFALFLTFHALHLSRLDLLFALCLTKLHLVFYVCEHLISAFVRSGLAGKRILGVLTKVTKALDSLCLWFC